MKTHFGWVGMLLLPTLIAGCFQVNSGPRLFQVDGTVSINGTALNRGTIGMEPIDGIGGAYGGEIVNGKFSIPCSAGEKRVSISAFRQTETLDREGVPEQIQYLPAKYNSRTELTVIVSPDRKNSVSFDLRVNN